MSLIYFLKSFLFLLIISTVPVSAYIDPGTGSYFFQLLIAFGVGAIFSIKLFWRNIKSLFSSLFKKKNDDIDV